MKIAILAGGSGTRLRLTDRPKAMVGLGGVPLLERLIVGARDQGFRDFVLLTGVMAEVIEAHVGDGSQLGVHIEHCREAVPLGTAGAVLAARAALTEPFIVMYGDTLLDVDLNRFAAAHVKSGAIGTLFVHPNDHPHDSDLIEADDEGRILRFLPKPHANGAILPNLVSAALYVLSPATIDYVPEGASDWGADIFPAIVAGGGVLHAYRSVEYIKDIGTPDRLARGEGDMASGKVERLSLRHAKPAIFLDRDGVLNAEIGGVHRAEDLSLLPGTAEAVRRINRAGVPAICVTNQPDIAKGLFTADNLRGVHAKLDTELARGGAYLDDLFYCPHHPERGWSGEVAALKIVCDCRKPASGMLRMAAARHHLDLGRSWLIGDRFADVAAAHGCGARAILLKTGHSGSDRAGFDVVPDLICDTLGQAVEFALGAIG